MFNSSGFGQEVFGLSGQSQPFHLDLRNFLASDGQVTVDPGYSPQNASSYPVFTMTLVSTDAGAILTGFDGSFCDTYQITCWSTKNEDVHVGSEAVRFLLQNYRGSIGVHRVLAVVLNNRRHQVVTPIQGSDKRMHSVSIDYAIYYESPIPNEIA